MKSILFYLAVDMKTVVKEADAVYFQRIELNDDGETVSEQFGGAGKGMPDADEVAEPSEGAQKKSRDLFRQRYYQRRAEARELLYPEAKAAAGSRGHVGPGGVHRGHGGSAAAGGGAAKPETRKVRMADGSEREMRVERHGNTAILVPTDLDTKKQQFTVEDVKRHLDTIPEAHRGELSEVQLLDTVYKESGKARPDVNGSYVLATREVKLYANDRWPKDRVQEMIGGTIRHEGGHALMEQMEPKRRKSFEREWKAAVKKDGGHISDFAKTNIHEDIAETIKHHWSPDRMERRVVSTFFDGRAAVLEKYGIKAGG